RDVVVSWSQPLTAIQVARSTQWSLDASCDLLAELFAHRLLYCLNEEAHRYRLYWLTPLGVQCQRRMRSRLFLAPHPHDFPRVDWRLYGEVCFSHRSAIVTALSEPLQPCEIKRRARHRDPLLRMSANHARDAIRILHEYGVVRRVPVSGKYWPRYELTARGRKLRALLTG